MTIATPVPGTAPAAPPIKDSSTAAFRADVIDASRDMPVLVDFWAPWCGPCRTLTPTLEKVVTEKAGKVRLVKVNIDENQALAGQMGIQSIPAVFAFSGGRPVDGFMGALPESEVRRFIDRVIAGAPPATGGVDAEIAEATAAAAEAMKAGDLNRAAQIYGLVLQHAPEHAPALIGMANVYIAAGDAARAREALDMVPEAERKGEAYAGAVSAVRLLAEAAELSETAELEARLAADPGDHQARYDLAIALNAEGRRLEAAEQLVALMRRDRAWNEDGARRKLLEFFEAWGPKDPATLKGRRQLSALLFASRAMLKRPASPADLPRAVPLFPLSGALLLPFAQRPLNVFEPRYLDMIDAVLAGNRLIGLIQPEDASVESPDNAAPLRRIGCLGRLTHFEETADGRYFIILTGVCRFRLGAELSAETPYRQARIDASAFAADFDRLDGEASVDRPRFLKMMRDYERFADLSLNWEEIGKTGTADLVNFCCMVSPYGPADKQALLEAGTLAERAETLIAMAEYEMARGGTGPAPLQ